MSEPDWQQWHRVLDAVGHLRRLGVPEEALRPVTEWLTAEVLGAPVPQQAPTTEEAAT